MKKMVVSVVFSLSSFSYLFFPKISFAAPGNGEVAAGSAVISQTGNSTVINQSSQNAVINWSGFNTGAGEAVEFHQPNTNAVAVNRITSGYPTDFAGSLTANGHVWILNPAGIVFAAGSSVNVAGLLATTMDIKDQDVMNNNYVFYSVPGAENNYVINNGYINAGEAGVVALVAPNVINSATGIIHAKSGKVVLATGTAFVLDFNGDALINFASTLPVQNGHLINQGKIVVEGESTVWMTAHSVSNVLDNVITMSGVIEAKAVENKYGQIILNGGDSGTVKISGKLSAEGNGGILTQGEKIDYSGAEMISGVGGIWTYSTPNLIIDSNLLSEINSELNNGTSVMLLSPDNIIINREINMNTAQYKFPVRLTLHAQQDININQSIILSQQGNSYLNMSAQNINISADEISTDGMQNYSGNINLLNNVKLKTQGQGKIIFDVIYGLNNNLRLESGRGIAGSVHVKGLSLGGTGGAELVNSSVDGHGCAETWNIIAVDMLSTGNYWFNGIRDWAGVTPEVDDIIINSEIFSKPQENALNLDLGEADLDPIVTNPQPEKADISQAVDVNLYNFETCRGPDCGQIDMFYKKHPHKTT